MGPWLGGSWAHFLAGSLAAGVAYLLGARFGLWLGVTNGLVVTPVWPPTAIALAAILLAGYRVIPALVVADFLGSISIGITAPSAIPLALASIAEPALAAALLRRLGADVTLQSIREVLRFIGVAWLAPAVGATLGTLVLLASGTVEVATATTVWQVWWLSDALALLVVTPFLLTLTRPARLVRTFGSLEGAAFFLVIGAVAWMVSARPAILLVDVGPILLAAPLVVWGGVRFGTPGASTIAVAIGGLAIWASVHQEGFFAGRPLDLVLLSVQIFVAAHAASAFLLAAAMHEQQATARALERQNASLEDTVASRTRQLARRERQLVEAQSVASVGSWEWTPETDELHWSDETYRIFGIPRTTKPTSRIYFDLMDPEDALRLRRLIDDALSRETGYSFDHRVRMPAGESRWVHGEARVGRDAEGRRRIVGTVQDITHEKEAEERVRSLNAALQARVNELAATNAELEAFSNTASHDLRAPLRRISELARIVKEEEGERLGAEAQGLMEKIAEEATRLARLIEDLLRLSRLGAAALRPERVDLGEVARDIFASLSLAEPERRARLSLHGDLVATADRGLMRTALDNLLQNSWKYSRGREEALIEVSAETRDGERVFHVRDNGIGFDPADADRLFQPFQRLPGAQRFEGTGVGLASVRRIIEKHGGRIWATGAPGRGATFSFTLGTDRVRQP